MASLTKPIVAVTVAREAARLGLPLSAPLGDLHPTLAHTPLAGIPLELALAHRAGLRPHLDLFGPHRSRTAFRRRMALELAANATLPGAAVPGAAVPGNVGRSPSAGSPPLYSDLGYLLVGETMERLARQPLDALVSHHVAEPLHLGLGSIGWWLRLDPKVLDRVVPTEHVRWRGGEILGQTHDENAWQWAGHGAAGHSGLFGTAGAVCGFGCALLDAMAERARDWVSAELLAPLVMPRPGSSLRAGFDGKSESGSLAGELCSLDSIGHLGFTGTSFWCDPVHDVVTVLLTNRVSPERHLTSLRELRPVVHDHLFAFARSMSID